jgi:restriction endonuclease Mrr
MGFEPTTSTLAKSVRSRHKRTNLDLLQGERVRVGTGGNVRVPGEESAGQRSNLAQQPQRAAGVGTSSADLTRVGRSGDAGIDGITSLDRLGLEKVYVQAKRWQGSVGRPELQGFFGALAGQRARKGVFITTSHYTRDALEFAQTVAESMVLVDGERLTELMIAFKVGVSHEALYMPRLDVDYFPE